jgi:hypothetical protein
MSSFWKVVHQRALKETAEALKLTRDQIVITALKYGIFVLVGFFLVSITLKDLWSAIQNSLILAIGIPIVLFIPIYMYKCWTLPAKMWDEVQEENRSLSEGRPRLKLEYGKTLDRGNHRMTYVNALSEGGGDVVSAQVVIDQSIFRARGSDRWMPTRINTRHIMSWANVADGRPEKYAPRQISKGDNTVDFITCPVVDDKGNIALDDQRRQGFVFRIDPGHFQAVFPVFFEPGTYKFVMQLSAPNVLEPPRLTLLVEWDGETATIQSEDGQVLETI